MVIIISDYQGFIIGLIPKMPKFPYLIFNRELSLDFLMTIDELKIKELYN